MNTVTQAIDREVFLAKFHRAQQRGRRARQWTVALRRVRRHHPAATTAFMKRALADLSAFDAETRTLFPDVIAS